jgi:hypothetical protein
MLMGLIDIMEGDEVMGRLEDSRLLFVGVMTLEEAVCWVTWENWVEAPVEAPTTPELANADWARAELVKRVLALTKDISQAFFIDIFAWCKEKPEEIMKKQGYHNGKTSVPK